MSAHPDHPNRRIIRDCWDRRPPRTYVGGDNITFELNEAGQIVSLEHVGGTIDSDAVAEALRPLVPTAVIVEILSTIAQYGLDKWVVSPTAEPPHGTYLVGLTNADGFSSIFHRDDAEGHGDPEDAPMHWWDYAAKEWISWPEAQRRGADTTHRLVPYHVERRARPAA